MFTHANIRTPRWLGYFISRPEMHAVHHERGSHSGNYCDLPVIDMIFGTYRNPEKFEGEAGFYDGASARVGDMILGRDVSMPKPAPAPSKKGTVPFLKGLIRRGELRTGARLRGLR
jgi:hypothetical protein